DGRSSAAAGSLSGWAVVLLVDYGSGDGAHEDHNPDDEAEELGHLGAPQMPPAKRVNDGNVAIQVDAHEEEAAAVHEATKGPVVVDIVVESQGQRKCEAEVTYGQVQHVDHHYRLQAQISDKYPQGYHIEYQTCDEYQGVSRHEEVVVEGVILACLR
uniref:Uncharacterized protein n=1 Tax=Geospiza parvula TaxID=87175 RepID=A0A8C3MAG6_GEOPR